jgi:predicted AAA+ superfamily ATPase
VCFDISEFQVKDREVKGLLKALVEFRLKKGIVITEDYSSEEKIKDKIISYIPLWRWLLQNN